MFDLTKLMACEKRSEQVAKSIGLSLKKIKSKMIGHKDKEDKDASQKEN